MPVCTVGADGDERNVSAHRHVLTCGVITAILKALEAVDENFEDLGARARRQIVQISEDSCKRTQTD